MESKTLKPKEAAAVKAPTVTINTNYGPSRKLTIRESEYVMSPEELEYRYLPAWAKTKPLTEREEMEEAYRCSCAAMIM